MPTTVECPRCKGSGLFKNLGSCIMCRGPGRLSERRLLNLRDEYWPSQLEEDAVSEEVYQRHIAQINFLLGKLHAEEAKTGAVLASPRPIMEIEELTQLLGGSVSLASSVTTLTTRAKRKGLKGRIAWINETERTYDENEDLRITGRRNISRLITCRLAADAK